MTTEEETHFRTMMLDLIMDQRESNMTIDHSNNHQVTSLTWTMREDHRISQKDHRMTIDQSEENLTETMREDHRISQKDHRMTIDQSEENLTWTMRIDQTEDLIIRPEEMTMKEDHLIKDLVTSLLLIEMVKQKAKITRMINMSSNTLLHKF
jgi:hypothetical protein